MCCHAAVSAERGTAGDAANRDLPRPAIPINQTLLNSLLTLPSDWNHELTWSALVRHPGIFLSVLHQ